MRGRFGISPGLEAYAREIQKALKTEKDLDEFSQILTRVTGEAAELEASKLKISS